MSDPLSSFDLAPAESYVPMDDIDDTAAAERRMFGYTSDGSIAESDDDENDEAGMNDGDARAELIQHIRDKLDEEKEGSEDESDAESDTSDAEKRTKDGKRTTQLSVLPADAVFTPFSDLMSLKPSNVLIAIGRIQRQLGNRRLIIETLGEPSSTVAAPEPEQNALESLFIRIKKKNNKKRSHSQMASSKEEEKKVLPVDLDTALFLSADKPLGKIGDIFGPVNKPYYVVFFESEEELRRVLAQFDESLKERVSPAPAAPEATQTDGEAASDASSAVEPQQQQLPTSYRVTLDDEYFVRNPMKVYIEKPGSNTTLVSAVQSESAAVATAAPGLTKLINVEEIVKLQGSDASWWNDAEVPQHLQDYSDDEEEALAKKRRRLNGELVEDDEEDGQDETDAAEIGRRFANSSRGRGAARFAQRSQSRYQRRDQFNPYSQGAYYFEETSSGQPGDTDMFESSYSSASSVPVPGYNEPSAATASPVIPPVTIGTIAAIPSVPQVAEETEQKSKSSKRWCAIQ